MNKAEFNRLSRERDLYLDGATGSNLIKRGMPAGVCPEKWILDHREIMIGLQREYIEAGSNIIYAPTFTEQGADQAFSGSSRGEGACCCGYHHDRRAACSYGNHGF